MIFEDRDVDVPSNVDVCIVGAGPVGLALALRCASHGLSAVVLESGGSEGADRNDAALGAVEIVTPHHAALELVRAQGIGGTSRLWGGRCVELDDIDFERRDHVPFSGWPIPHAEISAYYDEALTFLGCGASAGMGPDEPSKAEGDIDSAMLERWSAAPDIRRLHGASLRASPNVRIYAGTVSGIRLNAEGERATALIVKSRSGRSFEVEAKSFVLAAGGLENARLLLAAQRDWPQKFGGPDGALGRFYCGHLTGYLAAIRLKDQSFARGLWYKRNRNGSHLRRRLALSRDAQLKHKLLNAAFWLDSFSVADPAHGSGALSLLYVGLSMLGLHPRLGNGLAPSPTEPQSRSYGLHLSNVRSDPKLITGMLHVLSQLVRNRLGQRMFALFNPGNRYLLRYHAEQAPNPDSRVQLSEWQLGSPPGLRVDFRIHPQDIESVVRSHEILDSWLQEQGIGRLDFLADPEDRSQIVLNQALDGYHQIGLTRMSEDPTDGVVDRDCRVHGTANLFVAGSSVFPTAGQANPTLPAVALALKLGDFLRHQPL
jgi:choline dehydrogenase-like flavoprotein